jgi:peptidoglycan/xylan/chitin deacetylase (PgdA/CDA1 family)
MLEMATFALPRSTLFAHGERDRTRKRIALTFDDGPDEMTRRYLEVLGELGVRATFFVVGENASREPDQLRAYLRHGHEVGGHGWTHEAFTEMSAERLLDELVNTEALLPSHPGGPCLVRPPRGALSALALLRIAVAGFTTVLWSVDSDDCRTRDPRQVELRLDPSRMTPGDVVLLHEMQPWTVDALPNAVRALRCDGWEFVTVSELMKCGGDPGAP